MHTKCLIYCLCVSYVVYVGNYTLIDEKTCHRDKVSNAQGKQPMVEPLGNNFEINCLGMTSARNDMKP